MQLDEALQSSVKDIPRHAAIGIANDHAGFALRQPVIDLLERHCDAIIDRGSLSEVPVDFPDIVRSAVDLIVQGQVQRLILLCGTGVGACIAANKIRGIRAAVGHDTYIARQAVEHDDVNVLCLGAWTTGPQIALDVVRTFLHASFSDGEQFRRRVEKLSLMDRDR